MCVCLYVSVNFSSSFRHEGLILLFGKAGRVVVRGIDCVFWNWERQKVEVITCFVEIQNTEHNMNEPR